MVDTKVPTILFSIAYCFLFVTDAVFHTPGVYHRGLGVFDFKVQRLLFFFHNIPSGISMRKKHPVKPGVFYILSGLLNTER